MRTIRKRLGVIERRPNLARCSTDEIAEQLDVAQRERQIRGSVDHQRVSKGARARQRKLHAKLNVLLFSKLSNVELEDLRNDLNLELNYRRNLVHSCARPYARVAPQVSQLNGNNGEWTNDDDLKTQEIVTIRRRQPQQGKKKSKKQKKTVTTVVVRAPQRQAKKTSSRVSVGDNKYMRDYLSMLTRPFSIRNGVRCPFLPQRLAVPFKLQTEFVVTTNNTGTTACFAVMANPFLSVFDVSKFMTTFACVNSSSMNQLPTNTFMWGMSTPSTLNSLYEAYRIIGVNIKVTNAQPQGSCVGRLFMAKGIAPDENATLNVWANVLMNNSSFSNHFLGQGMGTINSPSLKVIEDSCVIGCPSLLVKDVSTSLRPVSPLAFNWSNAAASTQFNATASVQDEMVVTTATGAVNTWYGFKDVTRFCGHEVLYFYADQLPSTANLACFNIELEYFCEGIPVVITTAGGLAPIPTNTDRVMPTSMSMDSLWGMLYDIKEHFTSVNPEVSSQIYSLAKGVARGVAGMGRSSNRLTN